MKFEIVVIDDNFEETDPFLVTLKREFPQKEVLLFKEANTGASYILSNLNKRFVVFLDCRFDGEGEQGVDALMSIREKTSLVYIVMMSANPLKQQDERVLMEMVNNRGVFFIKNTDMKKAKELVTHIESIMNSKLDCALEEWILNSRESDLGAMYLSVGGKNYSLNEILKEIRTRTDLGQKLEKDLINLTIHLLLKKKVDL